jgi:hypothetical protein
MLKDSNNEICCHGYNHCEEENYRKMTEAKIADNILSATKNIEMKINEKPVCFRGPGMTTSLTTQKILAENGYISDFSICPQRLDFFNSKGGDIRWLFSPRLPYHPSFKSPYSKGDMPILVIPLSCIGIPFISGSLYFFGLSFMKLLFSLLYKESVITCKPIVYLFHSYEFCTYYGHKTSNDGTNKNHRSKRKSIHRFYEKDPVKRYDMNISLLKYILTFDFIRQFTGKEYCEYLNGAI